MIMEHSWMMDMYNELIVNGGDPRTKGYFLVDSPIGPFFTVLVYACLVTMIGPTIMKGRKPFNLRRIIMGYNVAQVVLSLSFVYRVGIMMLINENYFCMEIYVDNQARNERMALLGWSYYMMKYLDLLDTVFFVLTKKDEHISFLHLFHHTSMIGMAWFVMKYIASGAVAIIPYVNSWVHVFMYSYYFCSLYFGKVDLFFKKMMTLIQLGQFVMTAFLWSLQLFNPYCNFSKILLFAMIAHASTFIYLFSNFYYNAYIKPKTVDNKRK